MSLSRVLKSKAAFHLKFGYVNTLFHVLQTQLPVQQTNLPSSYFPVGIQLLFAIGMVVFIMLLTHWAGPKRPTAEKLENFESGIEIHGNARQPMAVKYFLIAILFVLFDVEVIFFYPYAVNFRELGWDGFLAVLMFVGFFLCGFFYIFKKGALKWED
jgi:NADH-quinone oxidoreductase subunit A